MSSTQVKAAARLRAAKSLELDKAERKQCKETLGEAKKKLKEMRSTIEDMEANVKTLETALAADAAPPRSFKNQWGEDFESMVDAVCVEVDDVHTAMTDL